MPLNKINPVGKTLKKILADSSLSQLDTEIIISQALGRIKEWLYTNPDFSVSPKNYRKIQSLIKRREQGEPIAYLRNFKEFYGLEFFLNKNVLIPRPETELLVDLSLEKAQEIIKGNGEKILIADIGSGSGCIITSLAKNLRNAKNITYSASDKSAAALKIARQNFKRHNPRKKLWALKIDLLSPLARKQFKKFNFLIITANLPYLSQKQYLTAGREIKYEPKTALVAKDSGMELIKKLISQIISLDSVKISQSATLEKQLVIPAKAGISESYKQNSTNTKPSEFVRDSRLRGNDRFFENNSSFKNSTSQDNISSPKLNVYQQTSGKQTMNPESKLTCFAFLEIDPGQKKPLENYLQEKNSALEFRFFKDLSGKYRVLEIKKGSN